jgi:hypothetical protein
MTIIGYFSRQAIHARAGNRGQATALFLVVAGTLLSVLLAAVALSHHSVERVMAVDAFDSIALSAATWEARGLNLIAALNDGVVQCLRAIRATSTAWAALAVAAAFGAGIPAFLAFTRQARRLVSGYWDTAHLLVAWSGKIRQLTPYLALADATSLAGKLGVTGALYPSNPRGPHDGKNTLELHLLPGDPIHLSEAIAPVHAALARLKKIRVLQGAVKTVIGALDGAVRGLIGNPKGPIRMLVPEKDFPERQRIGYAGYRTRACLPIPFLSEGGTRRYPGMAEAEPYGGGPAEMTWKSRLRDRGGP